MLVSPGHRCHQAMARMTPWSKVASLTSSALGTGSTAVSPLFSLLPSGGPHPFLTIGQPQGSISREPGLSPETHIT